MQEGNVTALIERLPDDPGALERLLPLIQDELKRVASRALAGERPGHTLQTTALVNEAFLRLGGQRTPWQSRMHFFAAAATTMRRILVDHARARKRQRRGGDPLRLTVDPEGLAAEGLDPTVLDLDRALGELEQLDQRKARCVELHYFSGLEYPEIASVLDISPATVKRDLKFSRAWLGGRLSSGEESGGR